MFFYDEWVVSVQNKQSYSVKEDLTVLRRYKFWAVNFVYWICPLLNQPLATLGSKCLEKQLSERERWKTLCTCCTLVHSTKITVDLLFSKGVGWWEGLWALCDGPTRQLKLQSSSALSAPQGKHKPHRTWQSLIRKKVLLEKMANSQVPEQLPYQRAREENCK